MKRILTSVFGILTVVALVCMIAGWCIWLAGVFMSHSAPDRSDAVRFLGACLGDGGLAAAGVFGWLYMRSEKRKHGVV